MSLYRRNIMVGVVVLGALGTLGWMLIQFGAKMVSPFAPASIPVRFVADRAAGISNGSAVLYRGVNVGRVESVNRAEDRINVNIIAQIDREPSLPKNISAVIRSQGLVGGGASIVLELNDPQPEGTILANDTIPTHFVGLDILPPEFAELATELRITAKQFRETNVVTHIDAQVEKIGKLIDSVNGIVADQKMQDDLRASLAKIRETTEKADQIADNVEKFSGRLNQLSTDTDDAVKQARSTIANTQEQITSISQQLQSRLEQTGKLLDQFQQVAEKVNQGKGTAGALVNDPKLYENLVDTTRQLNLTVADMKRLIEQWEQEGVTLKLK